MPHTKFAHFGLPNVLKHFFATVYVKFILNTIKITFIIFLFIAHIRFCRIYTWLICFIHFYTYGGLGQS